MRRQTLVAMLLLLAIAATGCTRWARTPNVTPASEAPAGASSDSGPAAPATPAAPPVAPPAAQPEPSAVSSTVTVVDQPWLTAPARVYALPRDVRLAFSAPVDRASVEALLKERFKQFPYHVAWPSDKELVLTAEQGCGYLEISAAGAHDAQGRTLQPALNPELKLKLPCHGDGYTVQKLSDGKGYPGFAESGVMMDTHAASGRLLGVNGTIYFLVEGETVRQLTHTVQSVWARFVPNGNVVLADDRTARLVAPDGKDLKKIDLAGTVLDGILSPDGQEAVLFVKANEQAGFQRLNLAGWSVTEWKALDRPVERGRLNWGAGQRQITVIQEPSPPWLLDLTTGQTKEIGGALQISSPDGRWVVHVDKGTIVAADGPVVTLTEAMRVTAYPHALWAPDSRHVFLPGGQVIDVESGREVAAIKGPCGPVLPHLLGKVGADLVVDYSTMCY